MLKDEVKQTNIDLELSNNEISELKKELDKINKECEETQFSLNIFAKKSKSIEEELNAKRDNFLKIQIQYKMAVGIYFFPNQALLFFNVFNIDQRIGCIERKISNYGD